MIEKILAVLAAIPSSGDTPRRRCSTCRQHTQLRYRLCIASFGTQAGNPLSLRTVSAPPPATISGHYPPHKGWPSLRRHVDDSTTVHPRRHTRAGRRPSRRPRGPAFGRRRSPGHRLAVRQLAVRHGRETLCTLSSLIDALPVDFTPDVHLESPASPPRPRRSDPDRALIQGRRAVALVHPG